MPSNTSPFVSNVNDLYDRHIRINSGDVPEEVWVIEIKPSNLERILAEVSDFTTVGKKMFLLRREVYFYDRIVYDKAAGTIGVLSSREFLYKYKVPTLVDRIRRGLFRFHDALDMVSTGRYAIQLVGSGELFRIIHLFAGTEITRESITGSVEMELYTVKVTDWLVVSEDFNKLTIMHDDEFRQKFVCWDDQTPKAAVERAHHHLQLLSSKNPAAERQFAETIILGKADPTQEQD